MVESRGFAKVKPQPKVSEGAKKRAAASKQYDEMQSDGTPEYEIYMRLKGNKNWVPVGKIAVKRSMMINYAIFANEEALLDGACRQFPYLRKQLTNLDYGYRLRSEPNDEIQLAVKPNLPTPNAITGAIAGAAQKLTGLFKQK
jgi:hypothetical protein